MKNTFAVLVSLVVLLSGDTFPADAPAKKAAQIAKAAWKDAPAQAFSPAPTLADVPYGTHAKQVLHFWKAESDKPTPLLFFIHGGGWQAGNRSSRLVELLPEMLKAGISVVSIEYRFVSEADAAGVKPPVQWPLHDAARALQFVRSKAAEWNIDKERIGASGGSAGACSSLWLAFHPDMSDPKSSDPVARESTRLWCAAVNGAQVSLDPKELREWMPNYRYGAHAFGLPNFQSLIDNREKVMEWIKEYSPIAHVSQDDPPIALFYSGEKPVIGASPKDPTHSGIMGIVLEERLKAVGVDVVLVHPGRPHPVYNNPAEYLIDRLTR